MLTSSYLVPRMAPRQPCCRCDHRARLLKRIQTILPRGESITSVVGWYPAYLVLHIGGTRETTPAHTLPKMARSCQIFRRRPIQQRVQAHQLLGDRFYEPLKWYHDHEDISCALRLPYNGEKHFGG